ncbi:alpha-D-ribose 1-methylphosphonate 5-triphosphate diphosphatase [Paenibacillus alkalitolerans]|uniref:alpha-D-ribose 1-methylphosphonate 5-triphosphate diphosphatase n=1 Tax=Paenibacillus alkalitolerans TaxID=2799335 RepID=UPI0018F40485|nr:alpha-D-ribose 1-methylphosphonate 5-triphosphate diphosphatase [Paenibacillus alkalitolerans]
MPDGTWKIYGGKIVTPGGVIENGTVVIDNGVITEVSRAGNVQRGANDVDASGYWIIPGIIDTHSDAIEHEMQPRPASRFPIEWSFVELERKLAAQGITTIYHSLSMWDDGASNAARRNSSVMQFVKDIHRMNTQPRLIRNRIHIRFEITNRNAVPFIEQLLRDKAINQLSFMDHTPGQGQYRDIEVHKRFVMERQNKTEDEVLQIFEERKSRPKTSFDELLMLSELAARYGIPLASHDDDSIEKLDVVSEWNASISEFPVDLIVAVEAKRRGMHVVMGAPNVMMGKSHSNNLSALEAVREGVVDIFCSDYYPPSMLQSVFLLHRLGYDLNWAVNMVTLNPAKALGIDSHTGSVEPGKSADLLMVGLHGDQPVIDRVWVGGRTVCQMLYQQFDAVSAY